jgi:Asp-tRNA(Asn)/Glu-tRNA(Gln) amidotransferase A subunit family amidase
MTDTTHPSFAFHAPFDTVAVLRALRQGDLALPDYLAELETHFAAREPEVMAFLPENGRFARLRREAADLLARYPYPEKRPFLFGLPVGVKDIFQADGFVTQAGCKLPPDLLQGAEAESVRRLRAAGALVIGKTVTTEFAYFAPGPTRNPHNPAHTPGGSSSGSAAAVGAGLCLLALGTQTIGSIGRPAAFCGVVGFKASYERISRDGVIPLAPGCDHVGFFAPDMAGAALAARVLLADWGEGETAVARQPTIAIPEGPYLERTSLTGLAHFHLICQRLRAAGFTLKSVPAMPDFAEIEARHRRIVAAQAAQVHADWFAAHADLYQPQTAELIRRGQTIAGQTLADDLAGRLRLRAELSQLMTAGEIDLWLAPGAVGAAPAGLDSTGDPVLNLPWTHSGLPTISLPAGFDEAGLPLGVQVVGGWRADERLLAWAKQIEPLL